SFEWYYLRQQCRARQLALQHDEHCSGAWLSPDRKTVAAISHNDAVRAWDVATGKERGPLGQPDLASCLAFSPDGNILATGTGGAEDDGAGKLKLWHLATGKKLAQVQGHGEEVTALAFSP